LTTEDKDITASEETPKAPAAKKLTRKRTTKASEKVTAKDKPSEPKAAPKRRSRKAAAPEPEPVAAAVTPVQAIPRLLERQRTDVASTLVAEFGYTTPMQVPRVEKVVLNIGLGEALENARALENATNDLTQITGQRPVTTRARRSIAAFKIREGMPIGVSVTLRGRRMHEFLDRLMNASLPRVRDFRGVSPNSFDGRGNFSLGLTEQTIFPEIDYNNIDRLRGLQIVVVTTARTDREGLRLLELLGMPFTRSEAEAVA
jgi:large subunit ribosomal protein L5